MNDHEIASHAAERLAAREGGWSAADAVEFARWRAADARHESAARRLESAQHLLRRLPESPAAAELLAELEEISTPRRRVLPFRPWLILAGSLAAAAGLAVAWWTFPAQPRSTLTFATDASHHRTVDLTDGSTLLLNNGSEVAVEYIAHERRVHLHQGEVHFSVAKDANRPFIVAVGPVHVRAVGTAFNIRRDRRAVEVVVTEGRVQVSRDGGPTATPLFLSAGETAVITPEVSAPLPVAALLTPQERRTKLAWQAPRLTFTDMPLVDAVATFNRYSPVQLEIGDPELANRPLRGTFDANNAEAFANLMLASGVFRVERVSDTHLILRQPR